MCKIPAEIHELLFHNKYTFLFADRVRLHAVVRSDQTGKRRPDERLCQTAPRRQRARPSRVNTNTTLFKVLGLFDPGRQDLTAVELIDQ